MSDILGRLRIERVIVHEVPYRLLRDTGDVMLSEVESSLDQQLKNLFREKVSGSLAAAAHPVVFDSEAESPVPSLTLEHLTGAGAGFVSMSQEMAKHLYASQGGNNSGGLLTVLGVRVDSARGLAILKLEKEAGMKVSWEKLGGKATFNIEHIRNLMLTDKTKVFKAGLFVQHGSELASIEDLVSDRQQSGYSPGSDIAYFFLKKFLGCTFLEAPDVATKTFYESTETFINEVVQDGEDKSRYQIALLAELNSAGAQIRPRTFAQQHLSQSDQAPFIEHLRSAGISAQVFQKDLGLIRSQLARVRYDFSGGIAVIAKPQAVERYMKVEDLDDGKTKVSIQDHLKSVRGKP